MDPIATIKKTRAITTEILKESVASLEERSEAHLNSEVLKSISECPELYPAGWYDPPPGGCSMLFDKRSFERLGYETLRDPKFWPRTDIIFDDETVGLLYVSTIDRATGLFGDTGLTIYRGSDKKIRAHIREVYDTLRAACDVAEVGMTFAQLNEEIMRIFLSRHKTIRWMITYNDPLKGANLGHTVPGSMVEQPKGRSFEEVRQWITRGRIFINSVEEFTIPTTCAFTIEARLVDTQDESLPNTFFHFIIAFSDGKKEILAGFDDIFRGVGMDYMLS
ncbi:hypothetical protein HY968_00590 [Candidatus Kaiserbacteria bacterium]|nr:hypothetical protein [Candidatus Kaiserbacteria bacterium]